MRRIIEDIENERFSSEEILKWSVIYPAIGLALFVIVSVMIGRISLWQRRLKKHQKYSSMQ